MMVLELETVEAFLTELTGAAVDELAPIALGEWSRAFSYSQAGQSWVARFSSYREDFAKDRLAYAYNGPHLPVPRVTHVGPAFGGYVALSERLPGLAIDFLDAASMQRAVPAVLALLDALRLADISGSTGYGSWLEDRNGAHPTWRAALLEVTRDTPAKRIHGWKNKVAAAQRLEALPYLEHRLAVLAEQCPEERQLLHSDLLHYNLLVENGKVTAVLDWGNSLYGDFLYELAWFTFWAPWHPAMAGIDFRALALAHYAEIGLKVPNFAERMACYELYIGLDSIAYCAFTERWDQLEKVTAQTLQVAG